MGDEEEDFRLAHVGFVGLDERIRVAADLVKGIQGLIRGGFDLACAGGFGRGHVFGRLRGFPGIVERRHGLVGFQGVEAPEAQIVIGPGQARGELLDELEQILLGLVISFLQKLGPGAVINGLFEDNRCCRPWGRRR